MTREELFELHRFMSDKALDLMKLKNHDYSKGHPLGNFYVCESLQICSAEGGIIVRLSDKLSRLVSILEKGSKVKDESIEDTIVDIINYAVLLQATIRHNKGKSDDRTRESGIAEEVGGRALEGEAD